MSVFTRYLPLDQFILIHGPNIPSFYAILFFTASDFISTRHIHSWALFLLWPSQFFLSGSISNYPLFFPSSILDTFWPGSGKGVSSSVVISFCLFILFMGFSRQEYWNGLPFHSPPVDHILSERFAMPCLSWVTLYGMTHSFIELHKPFCCDKTVIHEEDTLIQYIHVCCC